MQNIINKLEAALKELKTIYGKTQKPIKTVVKVKLPKNHIDVKQIAEMLNKKPIAVHKYVKKGKLPKASQVVGLKHYWDIKEIKKAIKELNKNEKKVNTR